MFNTLFRPNRATWETSLKENKPIIFIFQDKLCINCQNFDKQVLSDSEVQKSLFSNFIPIIIDIHRFPELYDRFAEDIGPVHNFFSVTGGVVGSCSFISANNFLKNLKQLKLLQPMVNDPFLDLFGSYTQFKKIIPENYEVFQQKIELITEITISSLLENWDQMYGGWIQNSLKYHPFIALEFLFLLYHRTRDEQLNDIIIRQLRTSYRGLHDKEKGGFFECANRDWSKVICYQKKLDNNIAICRNLHHYYQITEDIYYLKILKKTLDFCLDHLWDSSKGFFKFSLLDQEGNTCSNDFFSAYSNCEAASLLLQVYEFFDLISDVKRDYLSYGLSIIESLNKETYRYGIPHDLETNLKTADYYQFLLKDQVAYLKLLLQVYSFTGDREYILKAKKFIKIIFEHFFDEKIELFKDRATFSNFDFGPLNKVIYPVRENAGIVDCLLSLSFLTMNPTYKEKATRCVTSYYSNFGISREAPYPPEFVIANQRLVEAPIEMLVIGEKNDKKLKEMIFEMKRIYEPFKIIQILDPVEDRSLIEQKFSRMHHFEPPVAYVKIENTISPPSIFPKQISRMLKTLLNAIKYA